MAEVLIKYRSDADELKAVVEDVLKGNKAIEQSAVEAGKKSREAFIDAAKAGKAVFGGTEAKKALDNQVKDIDILRAALKKLVDQQTILLKSGQKNTKEYQENIKAAEFLRIEIDKLNGTLTKQTQAKNNDTKAAVSLRTELKNLKAELSA